MNVATRTISYVPRHMFATMCPVCRTTSVYVETLGWLHGQNQCVAVSSEYETVDGKPLYLWTCARHSLADVHRLYHPAQPERRRR